MRSSEFRASSRFMHMSGGKRLNDMCCSSKSSGQGNHVVVTWAETCILEEGLQEGKHRDGRKLAPTF